MDLDNFCKKKVWCYPNNSDDDFDRFFSLCYNDINNLQYFYKRDGCVNVGEVDSDNRVFRSKLREKGLLRSVVKFEEGIICGYDNGYIQYDKVSLPKDTQNGNNKNGLLEKAAEEFGMREDSDDDDDIIAARKIKVKYSR